MNKVIEEKNNEMVQESLQRNSCLNASKYSDNVSLEYHDA